MKAVIMRAPGGPEVLQVADIPQPTPAQGELLVRVMAVGVNPIDYKLRTEGATGPKAARTQLPANFILGFEVAGIVEQAGPGTTRFKPGDRVFYSPDFWHGAYAEYNALSESLVARMPANLSFEQAAAIPLGGTTAYDSLFSRGKLVLGETVLIAGANGGVGSIALQMAKAAGAFVIATCSPRSSDFVKSIPVVGGQGPDRIVHYTDPAWSDTLKKDFPAGMDLVFDCVGQDVVSRTLPLLRAEGRAVTIVNPSGALDEGYRRNVAIHYYAIQRAGATVEKLRTLIERKQLTPLIDSVFPLENAADAHRKLEAGGVKGKIVLKVAT
jgi:NADPH:quinone reductase-like Zn-dependent oxidoreductase